MKTGDTVERTFKAESKDEEDEVKQFIVVDVYGKTAKLKRANRMGIIYYVEFPKKELTVVRKA